MTEVSYRVCEVVRHCMSRYRYLYEPRLQQLLYRIELESLQQNNERFTEATFEPEAYGPFSNEVRMALQTINPSKDLVRRDGGQVHKYLTYGIQPNGTLPEDDKELVEAVLDMTVDMSTDQLIDVHTSMDFTRHKLLMNRLSLVIYNDSV